MEESIKDLTAYCGLYCADCVRYKSEIGDLSNKLLEEFERIKFSEYAKVSHENSRDSRTRERYSYFDECCGVLKEIDRQQCTDACRVGGGCSTFKCAIIECCQQKNIDGCWLCDEFDSCHQFGFLTSYHGNTNIKNLRKIRELGIDNWAKERHKFYIWE